jgi:hypothetical protein
MITALLLSLNIAAEHFWHIRLLGRYCAGDKIVKNKMGGACSADGGGEGRVYGFGGET